MASLAHHYAGRCHCGAVEVELNLTRPAADFRLRACQCGFCRPRGVRTISDKAGHATIKAAGGALNPYRFGLKLADYMLCARCGTYIAAVQQADDGSVAVVNVAGLDVPEFGGLAVDPVSYDNETADARLKRRSSYWMPVTVVTPGVAP